MPRTPEQIQAVVADALVEIAGVVREDVQRDKSLVDDLDVDSLSMVELMVELEQQTGVTVSDAAAKELKTVGDVVDYLVARAA